MFIIEGLPSLSTSFVNYTSNISFQSSNMSAKTKNDNNSLNLANMSAEFKCALSSLDEKHRNSPERHDVSIVIEHVADVLDNGECENDISQNEVGRRQFSTQSTRYRNRSTSPTIQCKNSVHSGKTTSSPGGTENLKIQNDGRNIPISGSARVVALRQGQLDPSGTQPILPKQSNPQSGLKVPYMAHRRNSAPDLQVIRLDPDVQKGSWNNCLYVRKPTSKLPPEWEEFKRKISPQIRRSSPESTNAENRRSTTLPKALLNQPQSAWRSRSLSPEQVPLPSLHHFSVSSFSENVGKDCSIPNYHRRNVLDKTIPSGDAFRKKPVRRSSVSLGIVNRQANDLQILALKEIRNQLSKTCPTANCESEKRNSISLEMKGMLTNVGRRMSLSGNHNTNPQPKDRRDSITLDSGRQVSSTNIGNSLADKERRHSMEIVNHSNIAAPEPSRRSSIANPYHCKHEQDNVVEDMSTWKLPIINGRSHKVGGHNTESRAREKHNYPQQIARLLHNMEKTLPTSTLLEIQKLRQQMADKENV